MHNLDQKMVVHVHNPNAGEGKSEDGRQSEQHRKNPSQNNKKLIKYRIQ